MAEERGQVQHDTTGTLLHQVDVAGLIRGSQRSADNGSCRYQRAIKSPTPRD